jgi:D-alanyl-D-alanine carboxypeptidase (penicillin-binding protein 5/6)
MAVALAEKVGGTESKFAALMTLRGRELGMTHSRFVNASGLPDSRQLSSARDIAILSRAIMRDYPQYYSFFSLREANVHGHVLRSHNHLMMQMPGVDGIKTGFTNASGYNLAASAVRNNRRLIAVVLGGNTTAARDNHVHDLLETGFDVLNRRQHGEVITVAQNLFEPAPAGGLARPSVEQGDADASPTREAPRDPAPVARAKAIDDSAGDDRRSARGKKDKGDVTVQVGAFRRKSLAQAELKRISGKFDAFDDARPYVESAASGEYRARFSGLTASDARAACATLKSARQVCLIVK